MSMLLNYIIIDGYTLPVNPTKSEPFIAEKLSADIVTVEKTITLVFDMDITDEHAYYEWGNLTTTIKDVLKGKYEANYTEYDFYDEYNDHYKVVIKKFTATRRTKLDSDGWNVTMSLKRTG